MTITEFLLARIAEDEAVAVCHHGPGCPNQDFEFSPGLSDCNEMTTGPKRWLAECEAKRRIVDLFPTAGPDGDGWDEAGIQVLELLALPYADHPDYDEAWRP